MKEKAAACLNFKRVGGVFDTENKMIKNIILDMGNVLIEYDVNRPLDALCPNEESKKIIRRELFESEDWLEGDRGNITDAEMLARRKRACRKISRRARKVRAALAGFSQQN